VGRGFRRHGATRLLEVEVGGRQVEATVAPTVRVANGTPVAVRFDRARLFPALGGAVDCRPPKSHQVGEYSI
jgi:sulfate transport system ATP-binding protein